MNGGAAHNFQSAKLSPLTQLPPLAHLAQLPQQLTSFIGREIELSELKRLLGGRRLITLTGAGGSGKTRLAFEAASTLSEDFPGGIFLVELAFLSTRDLIPEAVARVLGVETTPERTPIDALIDFLRPRNALLVLDNCEHLLDECAQLVTGLLASCPDLRVLATSREPMGALGECLFGVPLLSLPDRTEAQDPARLIQSEAVQLFVDRARLVSQDFVLTEETGEAVAQVCIRLDGIPLALELAAASLRTLSVSQLAVRLDQRFRLLTTGNRTALPRHQTLEALLDWSYTLLDAHQRILFHRLAIFPAEWSVEAAEWVGADYIDDISRDNADFIAGEEVLPLLMQLVNKSLVQLDQATGRYRMLETIRLYALDKLQVSGEEERTAHLHFACYRDLAGQATTHLGGSDQQEWFLRLETEQANLRAALRWAISKGRAEEVTVLALTLWKFWIPRGYHREARRWLEQILALDSRSPKSHLSAPLRARLLGTLGVLAHTLNEFEEASRYHNQALRIWREQEDTAGIAAALLDLGWQHHQAMDLASARRYAEESLDIARQIGDPAAVGAALKLFGFAAVEGERLDEVVPVLEESLSIWRELGALPEVANALANLGRAEQRLGDFERAGQLTLEALRLQIAVGDYNSLIQPLILMVYFEFDAGQPAHKLGQPLGYLTGGELSHGSVTAARLLGVMGTWQDNVVGRHTVQWDAFVTPLCEKLSAEMGEANFEREFQAGKAMSVEEIVELAETVVRPPTALRTEQDVNTLDVSSASPTFHASPAPVVPPNQALVAGLTQREIEVLRLVAAGLTNAQAAEQLSVTPRTINAHLTSIYSKTGVTSRAGAVRFAIEHRLA